ncbi:MAG TPA: helix-turn-helix domain-containing protein [Nocardioides sp.]|nr:helix-turn-helix domain-containing protein [Nocardioides sp.]
MARKYEQTRRAEQQEQTRRRIIEAAVALHGEEGPARTTMSAIAERAGVQRNTLYRHFPDERAVLHACSTHYYAQHPMPTGEGWAGIADPVQRVRHGLGELYDYWLATEDMTTNVLRDAEVSPVVHEVLTASGGPALAALRTALLDAWPAQRRTPGLEAALDLAVSFRTWQSLVRGSGLPTRDAADLVARMVSCAAG